MAYHQEREKSKRSCFTKFVNQILQQPI